MEFNNDNEDVYANIENLTLSLFKEQLKVSPTNDITTLIDFCIKNMDQLSSLIGMLADEINARLEKGMAEKGWKGISESAEMFGITPGEAIDNTCVYFSKNRAKLGLSRDQLMTTMMKMQSLEKTHRKFQQDNEGEHDGS